MHRPRFRSAFTAKNYPVDSFPTALIVMMMWHGRIGFMEPAVDNLTTLPLMPVSCAASSLAAHPQNSASGLQEVNATEHRFDAYPSNRSWSLKKKRYPFVSPRLILG